MADKPTAGARRIFGAIADILCAWLDDKTKKLQAIADIDAATKRLAKIAGRREAKEMRLFAEELAKYGDNPVKLIDKARAMCMRGYLPGRVCAALAWRLRMKESEAKP